jgi:hypothetical protein
VPGSFAVNAKEGSRSEILADFLFSRWGAVTPVRRSDDFGIDLYCTLFDQIGKGAVVRDYFSVQVKSGLIPWEFQSGDQVRWLVEYPTPLFLACVDKKKLTVAIYHVMVRFLLRALGVAGSLRLEPQDESWADSLGGIGGQLGRYLLPAPIVKATVQEIMDETKMEQLRNVFQVWVALDRENCDLARRGLLRMRIPLPYRVNEIPASSVLEVGNATPADEILRRGIMTLAEDAECLGGQLYRKGDRAGSLKALLLVHHLKIRYPDLFDADPRWKGRFPADLGLLVNRALNDVATTNDKQSDQFRGVDEVTRILEDHSTVRRFLDGTFSTPQL